MMLTRKLKRIGKAEPSTPPEPEVRPLTKFEAVGIPVLPIKHEVPVLTTRPRVDKRGRPRTSLLRREIELRPFSRFVDECLVPDPGHFLLVGHQKRLAVTVNGRRRLIAPDYRGMPTLTGAYLEFCRANNYVPSIPRSFTNYILVECAARGWLVYLKKTGQCRRACITGARLKGTPHWTGEDYDPTRGDFPRWKPRNRPTKPETDR